MSNYSGQPKPVKPNRRQGVNNISINKLKLGGLSLDIDQINQEHDEKELKK